MDNLSEMIFAPTETNYSNATPYNIIVPASGSPYVAKRPQGVLVTLGTVTLVQYTRLGVVLSLPTVAGLFELSTGDSLTFTYAVAPTVTIIER